MSKKKEKLPVNEEIKQEKPQVISFASDINDEDNHLKEEIKSLKRTVAGLKGTNTERGKKIKALEEEIVEKKKVIDELECLASKQAMLCAKKDAKIKELEGELNKEKHKSLWEKIFG